LIIKKVIITDFCVNGDIELTTTLWFKPGIVPGQDFESTKKKIEQAITSRVGAAPYMVEWKGVYGDREGFLILKRNP
jgi:hypothetical protein